MENELKIGGIYRHFKGNDKLKHTVDFIIYKSINTLTKNKKVLNLRTLLIFYLFQS